LIGIRRGVDGGLAVVMDLDQNVPPRAFALAYPARGAVLQDQAIGVSSGGRFLAVLVGNALVVHDLESGRCVGSAELPAEAADIFTCKELVFSPDGRRLATMTAPGGGQPLPPQRTVELETYDVATAKRLHRLEVPEPTRLLDVSPDGSLLLSGDDHSGLESYSRLDVWSPRLGRHVAGWRPTPIDATFSELVTWAGFVDKRHVLVLDSSYLTLWQLPECRPVYTIATKLAPSLSPNRKYFVERKQGLIRDSLSGAALVQLAGFGLGVPASLLDTAFTPDGQQVVGVTVDGPQSAVVRWDFATGKRLHEFSIPSTQFNRLALLGDRGLLLLAQPYLAQHGIVQVDRQQQQIVTRLQAGGVHAASPDGIYWRTDVILEGSGGAYFARGFGPEDFSW